MIIVVIQAGRDKILKHYRKRNWIYSISLILDPRRNVEGFDRIDQGKEIKKKNSKKKFEEIYLNWYFNAAQNKPNTEHKINNNEGDNDDINLSKFYSKKM